MLHLIIKLFYWIMTLHVTHYVRKYVHHYPKTLLQTPVNYLMQIIWIRKCGRYNIRGENNGSLSFFGDNSASPKHSHHWQMALWQNTALSYASVYKYTTCHKLFTWTRPWLVHVCVQPCMESIHNTCTLFLFLLCTTDGHWNSTVQ